MKKWTYLVAILAMVFATPVFTGCIDNEEPAGIEELRGAKAELLRAKAAVEAAKVAQEEAKAALIAAQAKIAEAKAAYEAARADSMSAAAAEAQAKAEEAIAKAKVEIAKQQIALAEAEKNLELVLNTLTPKQKDYLANYVRAFVAAKGGLDAVVAEYENFLYHYNWLMKTLDNEVIQTKIERIITSAVKEAEAKLDSAKAAYEVAEANKEAGVGTAEELQAKLAQLEEEIEALEKSLIDLRMEHMALIEEKADSVELVAELAADVANYTGWTYKKYHFGEDAEKEKVDEYGWALTEGERTVGDIDSMLVLKAVEIDAPTVGMPFNDNYKIDAVEYQYNDYAAAIAEEKEFDATAKHLFLNSKIKQVESWVRDDNDNAWTAQAIREAEAVIAASEDTKQPSFDRWTILTDLYKQEAFDADPSTLEGFTDVEAAVKTYNDLIEPFNAAAKAYYDKLEEGKASNEAFAEELKAAKALEEETIAEFEAEFKALEVKHSNDRGDAFRAMKNAEAVYYNLLAELDTTTTVDSYNDKLEEIEEAKVEYDDLEQAYDSIVKVRTWTGEWAEGLTDVNTVQDSVEWAADTLLQHKIEVAKTECAISVNEIFGKYWPTGSDIAAFEAINAAMEYAADTLKGAAVAVRQARKAFMREHDFVGKIANTDIAKSLWNKDEETGNRAPLALDAKEVVALDKTKLEEEIKTLSTTLYGSAFDEKNAYEDPLARLYPISDEELMELATADFNEWLETRHNEDKKAYAKANEYSIVIKHWLGVKYGYAGELLAAKENVKVLQSYIDNKEDVEKLLADLQAEYDGIEAELEANAKIVEDYIAKFEAAHDKLAESFAFIAEEYEAANASIKGKEYMMGEYKWAISAYLNYEDGHATKVTIEKQYLKGVEIPATVTFDEDGEVEIELNSVENFQLYLENEYQKALAGVEKAEEELLFAQENLELAKFSIESALQAIDDMLKAYEEAVAEATEKVTAKLEALEAALARIGEGDMSADDAVTEVGTGTAPAPQP